MMLTVVSQIITERAHEEANIIWGATFDENMEDEMTVTVIATGFSFPTSSAPSCGPCCGHRTMAAWPLCSP